MRSKMFGLLVVLALLLGTFGTAFAQDKPAVYCGDLSKDDCALLTASQEAMMAVKSYKSTGSYSVTLTGIPGLPAPEVNTTVGVDGSFSMNEAALAAAEGMVGKTQTEIMAMLAKDATPLVDLLAGWNFDATVSVDMTQELADLWSAQSGGFTIPAKLSVGIVMVDGVLYVDLTELAPIIAGVPSGWIGFPVAELVKAQVDAGVFTAAAAQMDPSKLDPSTAAALGAQSLLMDNMKLFDQFMTITRGADATVGDVKTAVFDTTFDLGGLIASPEFAALVKKLADSGAFGADAPKPADIDQALSMIPMIGPMIFQGLEIGGTTNIGIDDSLVYQAAQSIKWDLSGLIQMAAMSGQLPAEFKAGDKVAFDISTDVASSDFNADQAIAAPADAMMIPLESLTGAPAK